MDAQELALKEAKLWANAHGWTFLSDLRFISRHDDDYAWLDGKSRENLPPLIVASVSIARTLENGEVQEIARVRARSTIGRVEIRIETAPEIVA